MAVWLGMAFEVRTRRTALKIALVVGVILNAINQGDSLFSGRWEEIGWIRLLLTFCVPYCVSTYSSMMAAWRLEPGAIAWRDANLFCAACREKTHRVSSGEVIPRCDTCGRKTRWVLPR